MFNKTIILAIALSLPLSAMAYSGEKGESEKTHTKHLERITKKLDLSSEQQAKLNVILKDHHQKHKALKDELRAQMKEILSPEQMEKMREIKKHHHKMKKQYHSEKSE